MKVNRGAQREQKNEREKGGEIKNFDGKKIINITGEKKNCQRKKKTERAKNQQRAKRKD